MSWFTLLSLGFLLVGGFWGAEEAKAQCSAGSTVYSTAQAATTYVVPSGCTTLTVKAWGAGGGGGGNGVSGGAGGTGGGGGFAKGDITVTPGESLAIVIGGGGSGGGGARPGGSGGGGSGVTAAGGGAGGGPGDSDAGSGGGGGGYAAVKRGATFLIQAGGGGGGAGAGKTGPSGAGGAGGGSSGLAGSSASGIGGGAGTASAGGAVGSSSGSGGSAGSANTGGNGKVNTGNAYGGGGGGGGGRYGGGGGGAASSEASGGGGGGGGSSLVTGTNTAETAGSGTSAGNNGDTNYAGLAGQGGSSNGGAGNPGRVVLIPGAGAGGTQTNYRSIGSATDIVNSGTISITVGSTVVTKSGGTGWNAANRGLGDRLTVDGNNYVILSVDSDNQLTLTSPALTTYSGTTYTIARQFTTLQGWANCVERNTVPGSFPCSRSPASGPEYFPSASSSLVADDRREIGVAYKDGDFTGVQFKTATTDATRDITLTAAAGNRHTGVAGTGVVINNTTNTSAAIWIDRDAKVTVEWLEIKGTASGSHAIEINRSGGPYVVRNCLIHDVPGEGVRITNNGASVDVYNNIVYQTVNRGINLNNTGNTGTVRFLNNTVYGGTGTSIRVAGVSGGTIIVRNNIALACGTTCYDLIGTVTSSNNISSDATGSAGLVNLGASADPATCSDPDGCVGFQTLGATPNLHLRATTGYTNKAVDAGADLSALMTGDIDGDTRPLGAAWDIGADELAAGGAAATLSSAANQTFTVGQAAAVASTITVTDGATPTITAAQELRIRIPAALNMVWDPTVTTVTLGGGAAGKVSAAGVTYESGNKTVVLDVTSNFAASDQVTIAGLKFMSFTGASSASNLQLVVAGAGGATAATDSKTIIIVASATLSSLANQTFTVGQAATAASQLTVTDASVATITASNDIRIRIPAALNMTWDTSVTTITRGGGASGNVSSTVTYEDSGKTVRVNVTTSFAASDRLTIEGLQFTSFAAASAATSLQLVVAGAGGATAATDDKTKTIVSVSTLSSAANQAFIVGQASTTASTITVTDGSTPTITAAQELRIRIPAALNMAWDTSVTTVSLGGGAAGKVSPTGVSYEPGNKTVVLNVMTDFAGSDQVTIAGLKFMNFTAASAASQLELVVTGAGGATAAADDKIITIVVPGALGLSSAANQTFNVGQVSTAALTLTVTDGPTAAITDAQNLRIRIPAGLSMTWDPAVTTVTLGGGAAGKVSATLLAYENSNKTAVLNVTTNFAANDQLTISGLKFTSFTAVSAASSLQLVVAGAGGATAATDDKTIAIVSVVRLSSAANQTFSIGQASTTASTLTVTESSTPTINTTQNIRIRIPDTLAMTWDPTVTTITKGGTASSKVSTTVAYEDSNKTVRINVTTNFAANDTLTIAQLKFTNFTAISAHNLQLVIAGSGGATAANDDKTVTIILSGAVNQQTIDGCVAPGGGAITFDAASAQAGSSSGSSSLTWSHTVTSAGSDRILIVGVGIDYNQTSGRTVTGVTYGGVSMTVVPGGTSTNSGANRTELWYLVNPPTGTNNVVVTLSGSADVRAGAQSYTGVHQTTPLGTAVAAQSDSGNPSVTVSSAAGEVVVDHATLESTSAYFTSAGAGQTLRYASHGDDGPGGSSNNAPIGGSSEPGAASVTMSWNTSSSKDWSQVAVPLKPAPATLTSLTLPSWTPQSNELLLVGFVLRKTDQSTHSVSGNGLTWTPVSEVVSRVPRVALYRASGPSPTPGSIVISLPGNDLPAYAIAVRLSNVDTAINQGIEAIATAMSGAEGSSSTTDNRNMKVSVTTLTANATALAWGGQRGSATLSLPAGETIINQSSADCGSSGDRVRGHMWQEVVPTPAATQLGQDNSLSTAVAWAAIAVSVKPLPPVVPQAPGRFNAFEPTTMAGAMTGVIRTKIAGGAVALDVIALNSSKTAIDTAFTGAVKVEVLNASNNTGGLDANGCRSTWTVIQTLSNPTFVAGDNGRKTISFTEANSYRDVRLRISYPTSSPTQIGCSGDNFAIRPSALANFAVTDNDWQAAGTTRALTSTDFTTVTHKAGRPMSVRASAVNATGTTVTTNYTGAPTQWISACTGAACTNSFGTLTLASTFAAGQLSTDVASYNNVGSFALQLVDSSYASVDAFDTIGDCNPSGSYVCSASLNVGRFVPNHFSVSLNTPTFGSACGSFTYVGQKFNYATAPVITVTARDFNNNTTTLYVDKTKWWRISNATLTGKAYDCVPTGFCGLDTSGAPGTDPVIGTPGSGTSTLTFSSGTGFFFPRTTPVAPFNAEISLGINVIDADGIAYASNPARFGQPSAGNGITFSTGKAVRFGRFAIGNAYGSQLVPLLVRVEAQYWSGPPANAFITNTLDNCTSVAAANYTMSNYTGNLSGSPTCETAISGGGTLSSGRGTLILATPGAANDGSVQLTANLGATASGSTCTTLGGAPVSATTANLPHLQGNWTGGAYDVNPSARASFGVYKGSEEIIYMRENF